MSKRFSQDSRPEDFSKYADLTFGKVRSASGPWEMANSRSSQWHLANAVSSSLVQEWANITSQSTDGSVRTFVKDVSSAKSRSAQTRPC
jgi:hypothetical protein